MKTVVRIAGRSFARGSGRTLALVLVASLAGFAPVWAAEPTTVEVKKATIEGTLDENSAKLVIQAALGGRPGADDPALVSVSAQQSIRIDTQRAVHGISLAVEALRGSLREVVLPVTGDGEIEAVTGEGVEDWSERRAAAGARSLVVRFKATEPARKAAALRVTASTRWAGLPATTRLMTVGSEPAVLGAGFVAVGVAEELEVAWAPAAGVTPIAEGLLPEALRQAMKDDAGARHAFQYHGVAPALSATIAWAGPEARRPVFGEFGLEGVLSDGAAAFTLRGVVRVRQTSGGRMDLLSGAVALTETPELGGGRLEHSNATYTVTFPGAGDFPVRLRFGAAVGVSNGWNRVAFRVVPSARAPVSWTGLTPDTDLDFSDGAKPVRQGDRFESHLPASGNLRLGWRPARPESEGKLFFAVESVTQVTVSPGLLRQTSVFDIRVMQGELSRVELTLSGEGEVARVQGAHVLSWQVEPVAGTAERRMVVLFNQPQKERAEVQVELQRALGAFPMAAEVPRLEVTGATRTSGYVRVVNDGAVRLEVLEAGGWTQISPEQFLQTQATRDLMPTQAGQVFAFRSAGPTTRLRVQADNILPELGVSGILHYHLGDAETSIDAELEVEVREAPLRELTLRIPRGYAVARLQAAGLSDSFVTDVPGEPLVRLRLVYAAPVIGRQVVQMRLERNAAVQGARWDLGRVEVDRARSVRGHVGITADAGIRLTPVVTTAVTEVAPAFFPRKIPGLQVAVRLTDPAWALSVSVERIAQTVHADVLHLFSVGEGIAYGSSLINYSISGAPVSVFQVELSPEYFNVEFVGKNLRNWQKTDRGFEVQLNSPVSGPYALLATYERPFKASGETLTFTGARPADAQTEQGHILVISAYQFQVEPAAVSGSLTSLEPGEVPAEYRLFFDAPILAAHRYTARPIDLQLRLRPLAQSESVQQVVDRASLVTRLSEEGQVVTEGRYFVKNKGLPHLRIRLPEQSDLWSVLVDGRPVVPVKDDAGLLVPLPGRMDPNELIEVSIKTASKAAQATRVRLRAPSVGAPILMGEWKVSAAAGRRLEYVRGTLIPVDGITDRSGFSGWLRGLGPESGSEFRVRLAAGLAALILAGVLFRVAPKWVARRFGIRFWAVGLLGVMSAWVAMISLWALLDLVANGRIPGSVDLSFLVPIQSADAAWTVEVSNQAADRVGFPWVGALFLGALAVVCWMASWIAERRWIRAAAVGAAWTLVFWAALRTEDGGTWGVRVLLAFALLQVLLPGVLRWWFSGQRRSAGTSEPGGAAATAAVVLIAVLGAGDGTSEARAAGMQWSVAESVRHEIRVEGDRVSGTARIRWDAQAGQVLPLLNQEGVLIRTSHPTNAARLLLWDDAGRRGRILVATTNATLEFEVGYETGVGVKDGQRGFVLPVVPGLVNRARLVLPGLDVDAWSSRAVSVTRVPGGSETDTISDLVLSPAADTWIGWRPRTRDTRRERALFYAEWTHLLVPGVGMVEGAHEVQLRPAQGELSGLEFEVPAGLTITDVTSPGLASWRFDPDAGRLHVTLSPAQSKPFSLLLASQYSAGSLPFDREVGLPRVTGASGEVGLVGVATGSEIQLDEVKAEGFATMNLEDFPARALEALKTAGTDLVVRRAFRHAVAGGSLQIKASAVEPDVRVESQQTLSLSEDRVVLAAGLSVEVIRAGIFKLTFPLPGALEVESASGAALSHWTELRTDAGRVVTLHLKGKTLGVHPFNLVLTGPGVRATNAWAVPRLSIREATKQRGQITVVPEQGLRLRVTAREGMTQLDPQQLGIRQKGAMAFRLLQDPWTLGLDLERVDAWVQVLGLQHVAFAEAQVRVTANLQYEIENTGVKSLLLRLPAAAESVRLTGDQIGDFVGGATTGTSRDWEVKLDRKVIGKYALRATYTLPLAPQATEVAIAGVRALQVQLQRGFVTVEGAGRLQVRAEAPAALQPTDWQTIPRSLQEGLAGITASHAFRVVEAEFSLPVKLDRHQAARLLPARVNGVTMDTVVSDEGSMLTRVRMELVPGDKRLLPVRLPRGSRFWFAFVNGASVAPWQSTNEVLIPLERNARQGEASVVELLYGRTGSGRVPRRLDLDLDGPRFDLPLENIVWNVHLDEKWRVRHWSGTLRLQGEGVVPQAPALDLDGYLRGEAEQRKAKTQEAGQLLTLANNLLVGGNPQEARRAFQVAYGMSQHDQAFNEDARVQFNNLRLQQAMVGLNFRNSVLPGERQAGPVGVLAAPEGEAVAYTQQQAKEWIERNSAEDNAAQTRLAERLIQQQDAATARPAAIRASLPGGGRTLTFTRPLEVNAWAELGLRLETEATWGVTWGRRLGLLFTVFLVVAVVALLVRMRQPAAPLERA